MFEVLDVLLRAEGFFFNLDVLYGDLGTGKFMFLIYKKSRIRDKHPGSATLVKSRIILKSRIRRKPFLDLLVKKVRDLGSAILSTYVLSRVAD